MRLKSGIRWGRKYSIVVVSEGVKTPSGKRVESAHVEESSDPVRLGGIGKFIADEIGERVEVETRATVLGHVQRGGTPTARDRVLATRFGYEALNEVVEGNFDKMVGLRGNEILPIPLSEVADRRRRVDSSGQLVKTARAVNTYLGD